ncbi:MAG: RNA polymerase sigma factor [Lentisphaerae bacterium]|jgi:RNA polymerase sigma-70 factor (ECF subfamily)|nr:RNA polymerase sigma factor [Lentisphaerota bacterium]
MSNTNTPPPDPPHPDDIELMLLAKNDDRNAFSELVRRHQKTLLNHFIRRGVQYSDAEDLVQQTYLRLYRYRKRYQPLAKVTTFLFMMARQVWIDELRKRKRATDLTEALAKEVEPPPAMSHSAQHDTIDVAGAVADLPETMQQVIELGIYQGLPYAEIAAILGIPQGTVKSRMFNAIRMLREKFDRQG